MKKIVVFALAILFTSFGRAMGKANLNDGFYAIDQIDEIPYWQFIHVDTVNPENNQWSQNSAINRMSVISDTLFLSTMNENAGGEVWRTENGVSWEEVSLSGFGEVSNDAILVGDTLDGYLYAGTSNPTSGAEIWRCNKCDGSDWDRVVIGGFDDENNTVVQRIVLHSGVLYATTDNDVTGVEVWSSSTGSTGSWQQCNINWDGDEKNTELYAVTTFAGYLYVATSQWVAYGNNTQTGIEVWRTTNCNSWTQVNEDGFGFSNNVGALLEPFGDKLYVLTQNPVDGTQVWRCSDCDGSDWEQVVFNGFGDPGNRGGGMMLEYDGELYLATGNEVTGTEIWRTSDGLSWNQFNIDAFNFLDNNDVWSGFVFKNHLYFGTLNPTSGGQVRRMLMNPASITLPEEGKVKVNFISVGGPDDLTSCTGNFGLDNPKEELVYTDYLYSNNISFPVPGYFQKNIDLVFYLHPEQNELCTGERYISTNLDRAFITQPEPNTWILSWEDWTDEDFNDLHVEIQLYPQFESFLDLPFDYESNQNYGSFIAAINDSENGGTVTAYFDHRYPTYDLDGRVVTFHGFDSLEDDPGYGLAYDGHDGIDFAPAGGNIDVLAAGTGTIADIISATPGTCPCLGITIQEKCLGNHIVITHTNGLAITYGHLASFEPGLIEGQNISQGGVIGVMGNTGCHSGILTPDDPNDGKHIHFSIDRSGEWPIVTPLKVDPFGWLADRFPDSTYGESGDPDPWQEYNQNLETPRNATSDYLWIEALGNTVLSQPNTTTVVMSVDNQVTALFPTEAITTAFKAEMWPTLNTPALPSDDVFVTHAFALYAYVAGDIPIWDMEAPVDIEVSVHDPAETDNTATNPVSSMDITLSDDESPYHAYFWDDETGSWVELPTIYHAVSGKIMFSTDSLGRFVVGNEMKFIYLPVILK